MQPVSENLNGMQTMLPTALLRLMQLVSPALPVGAYVYSQGLEYAVDAGWVGDEAAAHEWIDGVARYSVARLDVPVLQRLCDAWEAGDAQTARYWNRFLLASRESMELQRQDKLHGAALLRLLAAKELAPAQRLAAEGDAGYVTALALASATWSIDARAAAHGLLWSWCENQVAAAIKLVPLGQQAGQRILDALVDVIPSWVADGMALCDEEIGGALPRYAIASALHETQYSRLFQS